MRRFLVAAAVVVAVSILAFLLITGAAPEQTGPQGERAEAALHDSIDSGVSDTPGPEETASAAPSQAEPSRQEAGRLLTSLRAAIAGGDWQQAKQISGKLTAIPAAFDLLSEILLANSSMEEAQIALRWRAAYILGLMGDRRAIPVFEQALISEKAGDVRSNIVLALGMFKNEQTGPILESLFLNGAECPAIRESAAQYLARVPGGSAFLADALDSEGAGEARIWAAKGLAFSAEKLLAAEKLTGLLLDIEEDTRVRCSCAEALGELGQSNVVGTLVSLLRSDRNLRVRSSCAQALGAFKNSTDARSALQNALHNDRDPAVRGAAARALGDLGGKGALADLKEALGKERDRVVRVRIVEALARIGAEESTRILETAAQNDPSAHVRRAAIKALKEISAKEPGK